MISRQFITEEALCLQDIWHPLRIYYGFRKSGALILDLPAFSLEEEESHEALWERMYASMLDNLLRSSDGLKHLNADYSPGEHVPDTVKHYSGSLVEDNTGC